MQVNNFGTFEACQDLACLCSFFLLDRAQSLPFHNCTCTYMPRLSLKQARTYAGGRIQGDRGSVDVALWAYDTRLPFREAEACFVALAGPHRSGATFIEQAYQRGVRLFCACETDQINWKADATYWLVEDVLTALQQLAKAVRHEIGHGVLGEIVGITGSNGKTIVKEWLHSLLGGSAKGVYRSPASFNSQLGVALSVLHLPEKCNTAIFEAGISQPGEMKKLEEMIAPTIGLLTNIGSAHDAGFSGIEEKIKEKAILFEHAHELIYQTGTPELTNWLNGLNLLKISWSQAPDQDASRHVVFEGNMFYLKHPTHDDEWKTLQFPLPFHDAASRENLCNAVILALRCGAAPEDIRKRIPDLQQADLRLSLTTGKQGCLLIDDTYNADVEGLQAALQFFTQHVQPNGQRILVLGPLLESGMEDEEASATIGRLVESIDYDQLLLIGKPLKSLQALGRYEYFKGFDELETYLLSLDLSAATILIKGPRALKLERLSKTLQRQTHPVRLEINLDTLAQNLAVFRSHLKPSTKICVMLKASAYGSGSIELVRFFEQRGIDYLAVANVDEGVELRKAGSDLPIIVANAQRSEFSRMVEYKLDAQVTSLSSLIEIGRSACSIKIHLKLDTGMHRLGFLVDDDGREEFNALVQALSTGKYDIQSVFSHLIASNMEAGDGFSKKQNERLERAAAEIEKALGYRPMIHLLNSSGALRMPAYQHDMVRLGIGLYGADGPPESGLAPAHRLLAQVVQLKAVKAGAYVGYGLKGRANVDRKIGVINIGYADGLRRQTGHGAYSLTIAGKRYPTVGSICMDFCMIDLSEAENVSVGDEVEVFGDGTSLRELAAVCGTIPYEILTGIGRRVQRVYYR